MNYKLLSKIFGTVLLMICAAMAACTLFAWSESRSGITNNAATALVISTAITLGAGLILYLFGRRTHAQMLRKEAIVVVGVAWIISALFGTLPYMLCEPGLPFFRALFESMSGFTTTGSTVIDDLDAYPHSILLWRSLTQWLGGLGILVLFVALLSQLGVNAKSLFWIESSANIGEGATARVKNTALVFFAVYAALSAITFIGLRVLGMTTFDSFCHAMTTVATGGFSTHDESIAWFQNLGIEVFLSIMMILSSISFFIYHAIIRRRWKRLRAEEEGTTFLLIAVASIVLVMFNLTFESHFYDDFGHAFRESLFQVASILTTTGFVSEDYDQWPGFSMAILLLLMVFGGCAGSTTGGIKINRVLLFFRVARQEVVAAFRPKQIFSLRLNGSPAESAARLVPIYIAMFAIVIPCGTLAIAILDPTMDFDTCLSATLATLFNIGPGFGEVGPTRTFAAFGPASCLVMTMLMALGRLELFAILVLFVPALWKKF